MSIFRQLFLLAITVLCVSAQEPDPLDFFPHQVGDTWAYRYEGTTVLNSIITSVQSNEKQDLFLYLNNNTEPAYKITNSLDVYFSPTHNPHMDYKLTAHEGSSWTVTTYSNSKLMARVQQMYQTLVFGQPSTIMAINYYEVPDPDTTITDSSPYRYTHFLASGFGFIRQIGESGDVPIDLVGCIINDRTFGIVTDIAELPNINSSTLSTWPNPCSFSTTLHCNFPPDINNIHLAVYNSFGVIVWQQEVHESVYTLNTTFLPIGMYFCKATAGPLTATHKLVIQR